MTEDKSKEPNSEVQPEELDSPEQETEQEVLPLEECEPEALSIEEIKDLQQKASERDKFMAQLQRLGADFSNYQKRVAKERQRWAELAQKEIIELLLPMFDNFERAFNTSPDAKTEDVLAGFKMIIDQVSNTLKEKGVQEIEAVGAPFDPSYHEAIMQEYTDEHPDMTVMEEFQKGYLFQDVILRPSKVKVARKPENNEENTEE